MSTYLSERDRNRAHYLMGQCEALAAAVAVVSENGCDGETVQALAARLTADLASLRALLMYDLVAYPADRPGE